MTCHRRPSPKSIAASSFFGIIASSMAVLAGIAVAPAVLAGATPAAHRPSGTRAATTTTAVTSPTTAGSTGSGSVATTPATKGCRAALLAAIQGDVEQALTSRKNQLGTLTTRVQDAKSITSGDQSTLETDLGDETTGIDGLVTKVPTDTTCAEVRSDARAMVLEYRVFYVMTPQVDLTVITDQEAAMAAKLAGYEPQISAAIANAQSHNRPVGPEQAAFTDYQAKVTAVQQATDGLSAQLLAQTPAASPGNRSVFYSARTSLTQGRTDLSAAATDLRMIVASLR